jgi:prepilin-type N-terminal cleavage/methylation domain-containing protein
MQLASRRGFTLVELLVAIVLVNVGLLALVGGSTAVVRRHTAIRARTAAVQTAALRLELMAATSCSAVVAGSTATSAGSEVWASSVLPNGVRELVDSVVYLDGGLRATVALRTRISC